MFVRTATDCGLGTPRWLHPPASQFPRSDLHRHEPGECDEDPARTCEGRPCCRGTAQSLMPFGKSSRPLRPSNCAPESNIAVAAFESAYVCCTCARHLAPMQLASFPSSTPGTSRSKQALFGTLRHPAAAAKAPASPPVATQHPKCAQHRISIGLAQTTAQRGTA